MPILHLVDFGAVDPAQDDHTCVALTARGERCRNAAGASSRRKLNILSFRKKIWKGTSITNAYELLKSYAVTNLCHCHYSQTPRIADQIHSWAAQIDACLERQGLESPVAVHTPYGQRKVLHTVRDAYESTVDLQHMPKPYIRYKPKYVWSIETLLQRSLDPRDLKTGTLYMYEKPGNSGLVKIGMTSQKLCARFSNISTRCGYRPHELYYIDNVRYVRRAEQLIFRELKRYRRRQTDCKCGMDHYEWFKIDADTAKETMRTWATWLSSVKPYDRSGDMPYQVAKLISRLALQRRKLTGKVMLKRIKKSTVKKALATSS